MNKCVDFLAEMRGTVLCGVASTWPHRYGASDWPAALPDRRQCAPIGRRQPSSNGGHSARRRKLPGFAAAGVRWPRPTCLRGVWCLGRQCSHPLRLCAGGRRAGRGHATRSQPRAASTGASARGGGFSGRPRCPPRRATRLADVYAAPLMHARAASLHRLPQLLPPCLNALRCRVGW